jgi:DNA-binding NarL/FixJ family response regulator
MTDLLVSPGPAWAQRLSDREVDVLRCLADGLSTPEIARKLYISVPTVKCHVAHLIRKVGVRDRIQLVVAAYRSGYVPLD